jgi:hypothetical protein
MEEHEEEEAKTIEENEMKLSNNVAITSRSTIFEQLLFFSRPISADSRC